MNSIKSIKLLASFLLIAVLATLLTWTLRARAAAPASTQPSPEDPVFDWLNVPQAQRAQVTADDPRFAEDLSRLRNDLQRGRADLAALLEQKDASDQAIRAQVESVIAANAALQRRVMEHVLAVRDHLTPAQQQRLLSFCAQGIRQGPGWQYRGGIHGNGGPAAGQGPMHMGRGIGAGRGFRGGRNPGTTQP